MEIPPSTTDDENTGLIGLGPHVGSRVYDALNKDPSGDPPLDRIFRQNTSTPNYLTVLLGRSDDPDEQFPGDLTVGELIPGYENVTNQPKLAIADVVAADSESQHWATLLDENGIVGPNGTFISLPKSQVAKPTDSGKKLTVVVSTYRKQFDIITTLTKDILVRHRIFFTPITTVRCIISRPDCAR